MKFRHYQVAFLLAIGLGLSGLIIPVPVISQLNTLTAKGTTKKAVFVPVIGSSGKGSPSRRADAGSSSGSDSCKLINAKDYLVALVPEYENYSLTSEGHPTFWFFVPFVANNGYTMTFELGDDQNPIYQTTVAPLASLPGIIKISLPKEEKTLTMNQSYTWKFKVECNDSLQPSNKPPTKFLVKGKIQRVPIDSELTHQLKSVTSPREKAAIYAQNGIWFEALTLLANLRCTDAGNPDIAEDWKSLLESEGVHLEKHMDRDIASKPIASCPKKP